MAGNSSTLYVPLRDEDTLSRSMSINERIFLRSCAHAGNSDSFSSSSTILRVDGRTAGESRPLKLHFSKSHNWSECSVHAASSSSTQVTCSVYGEVIPCPRPYDRPNDGILIFQVDASPMACIGWESSSSSDGETSSSLSTKQFCNRIHRNLERNILLGGVLDVESLCIVSGKWVWKLVVSITLVDHGGNCLDMAMLASLAALRHYRRPHVDILTNSALLQNEVDENELRVATEEEDLVGNGTSSAPIPYSSSGIVVIHSDEREPTPLPLHHTPLLVSFALFSDPTASSSSIAALLDPSFREEMVQDGTITFGFNKYGEMTCLDFPGGCEMHPRQMMACAELGKKKCIELCTLLETALQGAEEKAEKDRLDRLRLQRKIVDIPPPAFDANMNYIDDAVMDEAEFIDPDVTKAIILDKDKEEDEEEELYRRQALDYSIGHVAVKVKENTSKQSIGVTKKGGSLLDAMMKSAALASKQPGDQ